MRAAELCPSPRLATHWLCNLRQLTSPFWASNGSVSGEIGDYRKVLSAWLAHKHEEGQLPASKAQRTYPFWFCHSFWVILEKPHPSCRPQSPICSIGFILPFLLIQEVNSRKPTSDTGILWGNYVSSGTWTQASGALCDPQPLAGALSSGGRPGPSDTVTVDTAALALGEPKCSYSGGLSSCPQALGIMGVCRGQALTNPLLKLERDQGTSRINSLAFMG